MYVRSKRGRICLSHRIGMTTPGPLLNRRSPLRASAYAGLPLMAWRVLYAFTCEYNRSTLIKKGKLYDKAELEAPDEEACRR
jgi:hypothetical protein